MMNNVMRVITKPFIGSGIGCYKPINDLYRYACRLFVNSDVIDINGFKMTTESCNSMPGLLINQEYEAYNAFILKQIVRRDMTVVDIGANNGYLTLMLSGLVGENGVVISFEPASAHYINLKRNIELNNFKNIIANNVAISDKVSETPLYYSGYRGATYTQYCSNPDDKFSLIKTTTIDKYLGDNKLKVGVIKMDIDGYEVYALRGMRETIKNNDVKLLIEYSSPHIIKAGCRAKELWDTIRYLGLTSIYLLDEKKKHISLCTYDDVVRYSTDNIFKRDNGATLLCAKHGIDGV